MESPLSQESSNMPGEGNWCLQTCLKWVFVPSVQMGHIGHISDCVPPTSDCYNFFVRNPFRVFLDSMESPLSQVSIHVHVEGSV